jgi:tetratricopeptide (TPR) repeat protein
MPMNSPPDHIPQKLQHAILCHRSGRLVEAQAIYEEILRMQPGNFNALHLLGVISAQNKQPQKAVELISKAIQVAPNNATAHCNKASALVELGQYDAALASYDRAIALRPDYGEAYFNRGDLLIDLGRADAALASFDRAIAIRADFAKGHSRRGDVLMRLQRWDEALLSYDQALALQPDVAEAHLNRASVLWHLNRLTEAVASYDRALALKPDIAEAYSCRGAVLNNLGQWEAALASCDRAVAIRPDFAEGHANRGCSLLGLHRLDAALESFDRAIQIKPDLGAAYTNRGTVRLRQNQVEAAICDFDAAIAIDPSSAKAHFARAMALLLKGDFSRGWLDYEWRWKEGDGALLQKSSTFLQPRWLGGESLAGKTILLHAEQGLGDTIQFCRYVKQVATLGARVILQVPRSLATLLAGLEGVAELVAEGTALPPFDCYSPLLSLPLALKTTLASVPAQVPYLRSSSIRKRYWNERLGERLKPRVGLVWSGGHRPGQPKLWSTNDRRNIPLAKLAALRHPALEFYSLQLGQSAEAELAYLQAAHWDGPRMQDFTSELHDFAETAALIEQLDLVISVDTSVAHLAGALGKPVWILNRFDTCWRWLLDRQDSPWYPTARLYRQERPGDWEGVVERVRKDLQQVRRDGC